MADNPAPPASTPIEAEDAGCEPIPAALTELHEVLEWQAAARARAAEALDE